MTKRDEYQLSFQTQVTPYNRLHHFAATDNLASGDIAGHLTNSDENYTKHQIKALEDAISDPAINDFFWGEVMGSALEIFPAKGVVEIGDSGILTPIEDFKELLEEWLAFIHQ